MPLTRIKIENYKSIKYCDINLSELNVLIGENGTGKTNILEAIHYFYCNLTETKLQNDVYDENNRYSNEIRITLFFDFSEFVKISKSNSEEPDIFDDQSSPSVKYSGYYKAIISMASKTPNGVLDVTLTQIKGQSIKWNFAYEDRLIIKSLFPVFYIDTRFLDVTEWAYVWDALGELGKVSNGERKRIESKLNEILTDTNMEISKKIRGITEIFDDSEVSIETTTSKEFAKNLSKIYFSGDKIRQNGKKLGYYSTGTSSIKYLELLVKTINQISLTKLKEPVILIDEPEISLHPLYMDELSNVLNCVYVKLRIVISTHSARLTKNLVTENDNATLYNVKIINQHSIVQRMKKFPQYSPASRYRVTDDHINSYFSRAILFVEGETELELFSNPYIRALFPELKHIDVFKAMSQTPILNIMNPSLAHTRTPYLCLIDMDKALNFNREAKHFSLKNEYFGEAKRETYRFRNKHENGSYLFHQRKRIESMASKLHVHYYLPYVSSADPAYYEFIDAIHDYLLLHNVFCLKTTIEGCLINEKSKDIALNYLKEHNKPRDFSDFYTYLCSLKRTDKLNVLRIVFNGKSDLLYGYTQLSKNFLNNECKIIDKVKIGKKTSGWVSEYIDSYFLKLSGLPVLSIRAFERYLSDESNNISTLENFKHNFFELYSLIYEVCDMIK